MNCREVATIQAAVMGLEWYRDQALALNHSLKTCRNPQTAVAKQAIDALTVDGGAWAEAYIAILENLLADTRITE